MYFDFLTQSICSTFLSGKIVNGWIDVKAVLWIAHSNKKTILPTCLDGRVCLCRRILFELKTNQSRFLDLENIYYFTFRKKQNQSFCFVTCWTNFINFWGKSTNAKTQSLNFDFSVKNCVSKKTFLVNVPLIRSKMKKNICLTYPAVVAEWV